MEIICYLTTPKQTIKYGDCEKAISKQLVEWALKNTSIKVRFVA